MEDEIVVSVVTITYNQEYFIEEAINSILMQKCGFGIELIIANDHSTDNTDKVIRGVLDIHPGAGKVRYINRELNIGMNSNFLESLKLCRGKYIAICEGDDYWTDPLKLSKQVHFMEKHPEYSMLCHNAQVIDEITNTTRLFFTSYHQKQVCSTKDTLNIHFCPTASIFFRKEDEKILYDFNINPMAGDHFLVQLLSLKGSIFRSQEVMCVYRNHINGISQIGKKSLARGLENRIETLHALNKISDFKFQKNIKIEILLIRNRIDLLECKSKFNARLLKLFRKFLSRRRRYLIQKR